VKRKQVVVMGSTGSIGTQTLDIARDNDDIEILAITAGANISLLEKQIREFKPKMACLADYEKAKILRDNIADLPTKVVSGMDGMIECVTLDEADIVVTAVVGMIGIRPTIEAIKAKKDIALANKETLVTAGHIIMPLAKKMNVSILPVDSEHSAIFQSLKDEDKSSISKILLTASGGPFRDKSYDYLKTVSLEDALNHPNWSMGNKITIDSATMVNKGLEVMEAKWLFDVAIDDVCVVVHPQSIIHSMVEYKDGAVIAQLGMPDMKLPIQYALFYPNRRNLNSEKLDFFKLKSLTFEKPNLDTFKGLKLAYEVGRKGGSLPTVFNAANERAVAMFLRKEIGFTDIYDIIEYCVNNHKNIANPDVDTIIDIEKQTYETIASHSFK